MAAVSPVEVVWTSRSMGTTRAAMEGAPGRRIVASRCPFEGQKPPVVGVTAMIGSRKNPVLLITSSSAACRLELLRPGCGFAGAASSWGTLQHVASLTSPRLHSEHYLRHDQLITRSQMARASFAELTTTFTASPGHGRREKMKSRSAPVRSPQMRSGFDPRIVR
jgi:hypothetical protein